MAESIRSDYSGRLIKTYVKKGDEVSKGQPVVLIEALKTEMKLVASKSGKVGKINFSKGDQIDAGDVVAVIQ